jgi:hypothetical protein
MRKNLTTRKKDKNHQNKHYCGVQREFMVLVKIEMGIHTLQKERHKPIKRRTHDPRRHEKTDNKHTQQ